MNAFDTPARSAHNGRMSLTTNDLAAIRDVMLEVLDYAVMPRLDAIEQRLDKLELRVGRLELRMDQLEQRMVKVERVNYETLRRITGIEQRMDIYEGRLRAAENDILALYGMHRIEPATDFSAEDYSDLTLKEKIEVLRHELQRLAAILDVPSNSTK